jgi:hypothetical protein
VKASVTGAQLVSVLRQHVSGDWPEHCRLENRLAARTGGRVLSTFAVDGKQGKQLTLSVVTDIGHTRTFMMFPEESAYRASDLEEVPGPLLRAGLRDL